MLRLMRLAKMRRVVGDILSRVQSDSTLGIVRLAGLLLAIGTCLHVIACFWYLVGEADRGLGGYIQYGKFRRQCLPCCLTLGVDLDARNCVVDDAPYNLGAVICGHHPADCIGFRCPDHWRHYDADAANH
mmetsp:Transcript_138563/g.276235  ORF Transcript_138563/g.276235 Transcript_138563/m.276235 type:complete len:130 (-) Transcript_138563:255-644(-)